MERFNALGRGAQIMLVAGVLLFIDLFLTWQDFGPELVEFSGWRGVGVVLGILTIVLLAWFGVRIASVDLRLPVSTTMISAGLGALVLVFGVIKWLTIIDDEATIWAWIGLALAIVIAVGAWMIVQQAGGIQTLKSELPARSSSETAAPPAAPEPTPPPPAPPAAPEAAPPPEPEPPAFEPGGEERETT